MQHSASLDDEMARDCRANLDWQREVNEDKAADAEAKMHLDRLVFVCT